MHNRVSHSNAERRQRAVGVLEDFDRHSSKKATGMIEAGASDIFSELAEQLNQRVRSLGLYWSGLLSGLVIFSITALASSVFSNSFGLLVSLSGIIMSVAGLYLLAGKRRKISRSLQNTKQILFEFGGPHEQTVADYVSTSRKTGAEPVYRDGSMVADGWEGGNWIVSAMFPHLAPETLRILASHQKDTVWIFRPIDPTPEVALSTDGLIKNDVPAADINWFEKTSPADLKRLMSEFESLDVKKGKLQQWSKIVITRGQEFSVRHPISDGPMFRKALLEYFKANDIKHPNGRHFDAADLASVLSMTNNSAASTFRRFVVDLEFRERLRNELGSGQPVLPLLDDEN